MEISVPSPQRTEPVVSAQLVSGEQRRWSVHEICTTEEVGLTAWTNTLHDAGFEVEVGTPFETETGSIFGLRFKHGVVYGDLVSYPAKDLHCRDYVVRIQRSGQNGKPAPWGTEYGLSEWVRTLNADSSVKLQYFKPTSDYPPGYP